MEENSNSPDKKLKTEKDGSPKRTREEEDDNEEEEEEEEEEQIRETSPEKKIKLIGPVDMKSGPLLQDVVDAIAFLIFNTFTEAQSRVRREESLLFSIPRIRKIYFF